MRRKAITVERDKIFDEYNYALYQYETCGCDQCTELYHVMQRKLAVYLDEARLRGYKGPILLDGPYV